ncbi:MAG: cupin domain-containing protein [Burkholderiales bacterium]|nr:cupin domain-containing protein [Burkholderiales bacterium]
MPKPIINIADVALEPWPPGSGLSGKAEERYEARMGFIAPRIGAQKLGYNITAVPPGKSAFPLHNHHANEEMFFIVQGSGEVRIGEDSYSIRVGDVVACPPGGKERAHKIVNTGAEELRYLAVSTKLSPEVVDYPDSGKFGVLAELPAYDDGRPKRFVFVGREGHSLNYWEGE